MVTQWSEANTCHSCILASTWSPAWTTQCFQKCTNIIKYHVVKKIKTKQMQTHQSHQTQKKTKKHHKNITYYKLSVCILASEWSPAWTTQCIQKCTNIIKYHLVKNNQKKTNANSSATSKSKKTKKHHKNITYYKLSVCILASEWASEWIPRWILKHNVGLHPSNA
jgi:hypothetical protein